MFKKLIARLRGAPIKLEQPTTIFALRLPVRWIDRIDRIIRKTGQRKYHRPDFYREAIRAYIEKREGELKNETK